MKRLTSVCFCCVIAVGLFISSVAAQKAAPKTLSGGVLNGKAISLPKPPFPAAAREVGASGAVSVQVLIDENGDVISASAVSGHPLLRAAAVEAARGAKFAPTQLQGTPIKVSGIITYNFVGALYLARMAFVLSHAERTSTFGAYTAALSFAYQLPADWLEEKEILNALTFEDTPVEQPMPPKEVKEKAAAPPPPPPDAATNRYTVKGDMNFSASVPTYGPRQLDSDSRAAIKKVLDRIEDRASVNARAAWTYELGKSLGVFVADIDDVTKFQSNLAEIEALSGRAPSGIIQLSLQSLNEFVEFCKKENLRDDNKQDIIAKAVMLSNLRY